MTFFWLSFLIPSYFAVSTIREKQSKIIWLILFCLYIVYTGLRYKVGGDWGSYVLIYNNAGIFPFDYYIQWMESGYMLLNWTAYQLDGGVYLTNFFAAILFFSCLIIFCKDQPLPFLAFVVAVPYMITVISMGYSRQGIALGFVMIALKNLPQNGVKHYIFYIFIATLFHKTAVILLPLAIFYKQTGIMLRVIGVGSFSLIMAYLFLVDKFDHLWLNYVQLQMQSDGGLVRLLMNFLPSLLILFYFKKIKRHWPDYRIWVALALATLILLPLVQIASTAVDRVALYLIPLQIVVFSRIPMFFAQGHGRELAIKAIIGYYACVMFVWLNYATHAQFWLPYKNIMTQGVF